jgi:integration host factor subunit alpha
MNGLWKKNFLHIVNSSYLTIFFSNFIDDIFEFITLQLEKKNKVKIANFGSFNIRHKNERIGRNPKTKEQKVISSRTVVTFKPSKILKNKINKNINVGEVS